MSQRNGMSFCVNLMAILWLCSLSVSGMFAQSSPFHKDAKVPAAKISESEASQVLVLGTVHLRSYCNDFNHDVLAGLLNVNENVSIGIALATRLNHQRIYAINDHRDKEDFVKVADALSKELENNEYLRSQPWKALYEELTGIQTKAYASGDLLPLYIFPQEKMPVPIFLIIVDYSLYFC